MGADGWGLLDSGKSVLRFPGRHKAHAIAKRRADAKRKLDACLLRSARLEPMAPWNR